MKDNGLSLEPEFQESNHPLNEQYWNGSKHSLSFDRQQIKNHLLNLERSCYVVLSDDCLGVTHDGYMGSQVQCYSDTNVQGSLPMIAYLPPVPAERLGSKAFRRHHGVRFAYMTGAMANGIASEEFVVTLGRAGLLASFGSAGLSLSRIETAIQNIQQSLPQGPYCFNLIHNPGNSALEQSTIDLYLRYGVRTIEASAFTDVQLHLIYFRVMGLSLDTAGRIQTANRLIVKLSRAEVAEKFMAPPPPSMLQELLRQGKITAHQARLAEKVPMADDVTVEADSGGHTDKQSLVCLLPSLIALRNRIQENYGYSTPIRVGAAGGLGTPGAVAAAFTMGADYVVTGSINQSCVEAGTSQQVKTLLSEAEMNDVAMAPAADMFELGVQVQVLKKKILFPMRALKLYQVYRNYDSIELIPLEERRILESQIFRKSLESVWLETQAYLKEHNPSNTPIQLDSKQRLAMICRWYLGLSSDWANSGLAERAIDYQVWCGPAMGAFNAWVRGSELSDMNRRRVVDVAVNLLRGSSYLLRIQGLRSAGVCLSQDYTVFRPSLLPEYSEQWQAAKKSRLNTQAPSKELGVDKREIQRWLVKQIATQMEVPLETIDVRQTFESFGLNSAEALVIMARLEKWLEIRVSPTLVWNYPTIEALAARLAIKH